MKIQRGFSFYLGIILLVLLFMMTKTIYMEYMKEHTIIIKKKDMENIPNIFMKT